MIRSIETMRRDAEALFRAGVKACNPYAAVHDYLANHRYAFDHPKAVTVVGLGKAAGPMMTAALDWLNGLGRQPKQALVITNNENPYAHVDVDVIYGAHPVPDVGSLSAGQRLKETAQSLGPDDLLLLLLSGGGSALQVAPVAGLTLDDKIDITRRLLTSGATIHDINIVRQALSELKGGGLQRLAAPAQVLTLILSDVAGDDIDIIASGPTTLSAPAPGAAIDVLKTFGIWEELGAHLTAVLKKDRHRDVEKSEARRVVNAIIGSNAIAVDAVRQTAQAHYQTTVLGDWLAGDVAEAANTLLHTIRGWPKANGGRPSALISGGETTVQVTGQGRGGRNQELALHFARLADHQEIEADWVFLSAGTDGRDGPTDAAGGLVDCTTMRRLNEAGINVAAGLADNNSYSVLNAVGDLLVTGGTGTNVADLQIFLWRPEANSY